MSTNNGGQVGPTAGIGMEALLSVDGAAALLAVPKSWVYQAAETGRLPCFKIGRYVRFKATDLIDWVELQKRSGR